MKMVPVLVALALFAWHASAMQFHLEDKVIYATGPIESGDAAQLMRLIQEKNLASGFEDYVVRLDSPGGLTLEGMQVGRVIRRAALETFVARGDVCASACALAFLGGTRRYATGFGVGRRLEFGAGRGFHGFRPPTDTVQLENETLSMSRLLTALILEYATEMRSIDLGWLASTLNVAPEKLFMVRRPGDIAALSIFLEGMPNTVPNDWYLNACRLVVKDETPSLEDPGARVIDRSEPIPTSKPCVTSYSVRDLKAVPSPHWPRHCPIQTPSTSHSAAPSTSTCGSPSWRRAASLWNAAPDTTTIGVSQSDGELASPL